MDTISRESSSSPLPLVGVIAGLLALVLAAVALVKVSTANKAVTAQEAKLTRIDDIDNRVAQVNALAQDTQKRHNELFNSADQTIKTLYSVIQETEKKVLKLEEAAAKKTTATAAAPKGGAAPAPVGPDEYVIKSGDNFSSIARAHGTTAAAIAEVNPGVSSNQLRVGQKINLPKAGAAAPAAR